MEGGGGMERWREMFRDTDIYDVIRNAILIAGADSPRELLRRRQGIIEWLFSVAPAAPVACGSVDGGNCLPAIDGGGHYHDNNGNFAATEAPPSLIDQQILEALYDEIEEDTQVINEVLRIKDILINYKEQSEDTLFDGLRRLQLMRLSISVLKSTQIAEAAAPLNKHRSPVICKIARDLAEGWKEVAAAWVEASANADTSSNTSNPSTVEDNFGLPTPRLDVGAFFLPQSTAEQYVYEFLHEVDDHDDGRYKMVIAQPVANMNENIMYKGQDLSRQHDPPMSQANLQKKLKLERQAPTLEGCKVGIEKRNTNIADLRLEATRRKLNHAYQEADNEKKKHCVQYVDMHDVIQNLQQRRATTTSTKQRRNRPNERFSVSRSRK